MRAEKPIAVCLHRLVRNEAIWHSTLLVIFYDEHGGFYDHVEPPAAPVPDDYVAVVKYKDGTVRPFKFNRFGCAPRRSLFRLGSGPASSTRSSTIRRC